MRGLVQELRELGLVVGLQRGVPAQRGRMGRFGTKGVLWGLLDSCLLGVKRFQVEVLLRFSEILF